MFRNFIAMYVMYEYITFEGCDSYFIIYAIRKLFVRLDKVKYLFYRPWRYSWTIIIKKLWENSFTESLEVSYINLSNRTILLRRSNLTTT